MKQALIPVKLVKQKNYVSLLDQLNKRQIEIKAATEFVKAIERGELDALYDGSEVVDTSTHNGLATSLVSMRNQMKRIAEEEKERNWATEGLAKFMDILRSNNDNQHALADHIISHLVKYLNANQGALFVLNDDNPNDIHLNLIGCYAYDRKKYLNKQIRPGEGLAGQVLLEKDTIFMTDIPKNYVSITSGLGHALPTNIIIVPLMINQEVHGVIELASFNAIEKYQRAFIEKLGESIASTISTVKINERTKRLLAETQQQTEEMRAQEEEMRQNVEELAATQEDMSRVLREVQDKETYMNNLINATHDAILTVDRNYNITVANTILLDTFRSQGIYLEKGDSVFKTMKPEQVDAARALYDRAFAGESINATKEYFGRHYIVSYNPIKDAQGAIIGASIYTREITDQIKSQQKTEELLKLQEQRATIMEQNRNVLNKLTKSNNIQNGNLNEALEEITQAMSTVFKVSRSAIWSYNEKKSSICLEKQYLNQDHKFEQGGELYKKDIPTYFSSVEQEEVIQAENTFEHPSLIEFRKGYLDVLDIQSMLDVPFFLNGKLGGVICCENQGQQKKWSPEDVEFGQSVADIITIAFKSAQMKKLLQESQAKTEEIMAQEEEMRQNMEEMQAIQEELARKNNDTEAQKSAENQKTDQIIAKLKNELKEKESVYQQKIDTLQKQIAVFS